MSYLVTKAKGLAQIAKNEEKILALQKCGVKTKIDKVAIYLLKGRPVTGATLVHKFHCYSYRDVIYDLSKRGYEIEHKDIVEKDITHRIWWLKEFDYEFIAPREEKIF